MSKFRGPGKWRSDAPQRVNTGSSIRGKTISNPIPLDDDEFPIRTPGAGIATPLGTEGIEKQLQLQKAAAAIAARPDSLVRSEHNVVSDYFEQITAEEMSPVTPPQPTYDAPPPPAETRPVVIPASLASKPSGSSEKTERKKSSLRSVFGRLFGRKRKSNTPSSPGIPERSDLRAGQHRSDPTALSRTAKLSPQRSASLPINEFNRALRSHSTVTEDFPLTDAHDVNRQSLQGEGHGRPRRATTPSRLWTPNKTPGYMDWTGLSPRPASSHARGSKVEVEEEIEPDIGVAVTSGSHPNRRSRSVGELRQEAAPALTRRRSDEIRYWRESYDPGILSPMSSNKAEADELIVLDKPEQPANEEPVEVPQPFNFGPMHLNEMAGMKITQAASLETRVLRLEKRMQELERAVSRTHNRISTEPLVFQDPPRRSSKRDRSTSAARPRTDESEMSLPQQRYRGTHQTFQQESGRQVRSSSYGSSRPSTTSTSNSYAPPEDTDFSSSQNTARPLSTSTTIRGVPSSSPTVQKDGGHLTAEHYTALTNMIIAEQEARKNLEAVVRKLQEQLKTVLLSSTAPAHSMKAPATTAGGEFSSFEQDDSSDDDGRYEREAFLTPNEERAQFGDEIFGTSNLDTESKSAPRTLSLSQMTYPSQPSLNF